MQFDRSAVQIRLLPFSLLWVYLLKDFRRSNLRLVSIVHYFEFQRHMNHAFSSYFVVFYDRLLYFWGINALLRDCSQNQIYLLYVRHVGIQLNGRAFDCRSRGRRFNSARSLLHYCGFTC